MDLRYPLGLCLLGLCIYSGIVGPQWVYNIPKALADPISSAGRELRLQYVRVVQVLPGTFKVQQLGKRISVQIPENLQKEWELWRKQLQVGNYVSLKAAFHPEKYLLLRQMHVHEGRRLKIWVSLLALLLLAGLLIHERMKVSLGHA